jgi:nucleotide-binding universal stress UspA family protein
MAITERRGPVANILVYIDGTEESVTAAQYAVLLARSTGSRLTAVYIVNTRALSDLVRARIFLPEEQNEYQRDIEADADRYLRHVERLAAERGVDITCEKRSGNVHQELKTLVDELDADLLVIGELSKIRSRRDEIFNEAERAMRGVRCSVLIVKDPDRVWDLFENEQERST